MLFSQGSSLSAPLSQILPWLVFAGVTAVGGVLSRLYRSRALSSLRGIGVWTAEMILLFCLQRPDIFSYDDLAIRRGLRMVYRHRRIDRALFERYRRRFHPYGSGGEPVSLGRLRRRDPGADGPRAEERERRKIT